MRRWNFCCKPNSETAGGCCSNSLLLLLLRILIVLAILALLARLILDPRLTVFGGEGKAHHLVVLDDSASMWNRWGDTTAFEEAKKVIRKLVREGAKRPQTQKFSMVLLSKPNDFFIAEKDVDDELLRDLEDKLENLKPSYKPARFAGRAGNRRATSAERPGGDQAPARALRLPRRRTGKARKPWAMSCPN